VAATRAGVTLASGMTLPPLRWPRALAKAAVEDTSGDTLDAALCALAAATAVRAGPSSYGLPPFDPVEGWIAGTPPAGITASGTASERSFTGQASALSNWFDSVDAPTYLGAAGQSLNLAVTRGAVSVQTALALYGSSAASSTAPSLAAVPQTVFITAGTASTLVFGGAALEAADPAAELELRLSLPAGVLLLHEQVEPKQAPQRVAVMLPVPLQRVLESHCRDAAFVGQFIAHGEQGG
jgi:hypothetical protein